MQLAGSKAKRSRDSLGRGKPKHVRLRTYLVSEMAAGALHPGDVLAPERELAQIMQISRTTVRQALDDLEREGLVRRVQGKGTFVAEPAGTDAARVAALAIVVLDVASGYYRSLLSGFEDACAEAGRPAIVCNSSNSVDRQANHLMRLLAHRVSGVVVNPTASARTPPYQIELLQDSGIPVVLLHRAIQDVTAPVLEMPVREMGDRAMQLLLLAGHRSIAFFDSYRDELSSQTEDSLHAALKSAGVDMPATHVVYGEGGKDGEEQNFHDYERMVERKLPELLSQQNRPTAILAGCDTVAEQVYLATQRLGIRVPEDLSLVCLGGAHRDGAILKRVTAVTIDEIAAGKKAVELLVEMRSGRRSIKDSQMMPLPLSVYPGDTLRPPATKP